MPSFFCNHWLVHNSILSYEIASTYLENLLKNVANHFHRKLRIQILDIFPHFIFKTWGLQLTSLFSTFVTKEKNNKSPDDLTKMTNHEHWKLKTIHCIQYLPSSWTISLVTPLRIHVDLGLPGKACPHIYVCISLGSYKSLVREMIKIMLDGGLNVLENETWESVNIKRSRYVLGWWGRDFES